MSDPSRALRADPLRAHGAWIFLFCAVGVGAFAARSGRVELAMLIGTVFAGSYLAGAAVSYPSRRRVRRLALGAALAGGSALLATLLQTDTRWMRVAAIAAVPALVTIALVRSRGLVSRWTLVCGAAAIALAAPTVALAGGASTLQGAVLFACLWPVFSWRSLIVAHSLASARPLEARALRRRGLREARIAAVWSLVVASTVRIW